MSQLNCCNFNLKIAYNNFLAVYLVVRYLLFLFIAGYPLLFENFWFYQLISLKKLSRDFRTVQFPKQYKSGGKFQIIFDR